MVKEMKTRIHYYSERGMVNAIVLSLYTYKRAAFHFLKAIKNIKNKSFFVFDLKSIKSINIFNEISFGQFGDPDLIIRVDFKEIEKNKPILFFIEAKVGTYDNSAKYDIKDGYNKNASRINFQLRLKKRFIDAWIRNKESQTIEECENHIDKEYDRDKYNNYRNRALKKKELVKFIKKYILCDIEKDNIYYVSMTNDDCNPYKNNIPFETKEDEYNKLAYINYKDIIECKPTNKSKEKCILYGKTYDMFTNAMQLANDDKYDDDEEDES